MAENLSPKSRLMSNKSTMEAHHSLVDKPAFQFGMDFALLEYQRVLCEQRADMQGAAANHFKLVGAQEFAHVLRTLADSPKSPAPPPQQNLDHKVN